MVGRRHFLYFLGGGAATLVAGAGVAWTAVERVSALGSGPAGELGLDRHDHTGETEGLDGYGLVNGPPAISKAPVSVQMVYPVVGGATFTDTYLACRDGCRRHHLGQDLFAPKLRPVVASFDGIISDLQTDRPLGGNLLSIRSPDGWTINYLHLNNDLPGTDDGKGTALHAFAPGIRKGVSVRAGQLLGWVGDSGNAETVAPHLHFELRKGDAWTGTVHNPKISLDQASRLGSAALGGPLPEGVVARAKGGANFWLIDQGRRRRLLPGVRAANGHDVQPTVRVSMADLLAHPEGARVGLRDGLVLRAPDGRRWAITEGRRRRLSVAGLRKLGLTDRALRPVDAAALGTMPIATGEQPAPTRPGALLKRPGSPPVWLVTEDGHRRHVPDLETLASWGWRHLDVAEVTTAVLAKLPVAAPLPLRDGTLARTPDGALHLVAGGRRRAFRSRAAATAAGWPALSALVVPATTLARLPLGFPMP